MKLKREKRPTQRRGDRALKLSIFSLSISLVLLLAVTVEAILPNSPYLGGWEATTGGDDLSISDVERDITGKHYYIFDPDGYFEDAVDAQGSYQNIWPSNYDDPGCSVTVSYPYYITRTGSGSWVESDNAVILDSYTTHPNATRAVVYNHYTLGLDVTLKTSARSYYKPVGSYLDYGYFYEANPVDIVAWSEIGITPWTPSGTDGNWTVRDGWTGIMSASVYAVEYGLVDENAQENYGHTIQDLLQVNSPANMDAQPVEFSNPSALAGVPETVSVEVSARLGAGAEYTTDWAGHWTSVAVRNVFVTYKLRVDICTVLDYALNLGHQGGLEDPEENNTGYAPQITPLADLLNWLENAFPGFRDILVLVVFLIFGVLGILIVVKVVRR